MQPRDTEFRFALATAERFEVAADAVGYFHTGERAVFLGRGRSCLVICCHCPPPDSERFRPVDLSPTPPQAEDPGKLAAQAVAKARAASGKPRRHPKDLASLH